METQVLPLMYDKNGQYHLYLLNALVSLNASNVISTGHLLAGCTIKILILKYIFQY